VVVIEGEAYEFVKKYVFFPGEPLRGVSAFAEPIGRRRVEVKYVVPVPAIPARTLNVLKAGELPYYVGLFIASGIENREHWKYPNEGAYVTEDVNTALFLADMVKRRHGGCWIIRAEEKYYVWSRGYFHYVGA